MDGKKQYEEAKLEMILISSRDMITTSTALGDGDNYDKDAWA